MATGYWLLATGYWLLAVGLWLLAAGGWRLASGYWRLATGCWLLASGYWPLAVGCWLLAAGLWLLAASFGLVESFKYKTIKDLNSCPVYRYPDQNSVINHYKQMDFKHLTDNERHNSTFYRYLYTQKVQNEKGASISNFCESKICGQ
jgi:hypothetical protein